MTLLFKRIHERYKGKAIDSLLRIAELGAVAFLSGWITMYGTVREVKGQVGMLCQQVSELSDRIDKHLQDYSIHVPHRK